MRIEKMIHDYYETRVAGVSVPPMPDYDRAVRNSISSGRIAALAFAAVLVLSFVPFFYCSGKNPELSERAAVFCSKYEIGSRITEGIFNLHRIAE